jgi:two-component system response regulator FixJ
MPSNSIVHIIDDDDAAREALAFLLDCYEIATRTHASAVEYLKVAGSNDVGCIITDVRMPEMTGLELVQHLKARGVGEPIIMITGHADVPMAIQAMHAGVTDFIEKPFSDDEILGAVRRALAQRRSRSEIEEERDAIRRRLVTLSGREAEVMEGLVRGKPNKISAFELGISARTVEVYRANVMAKMGASSLSELVRMVMIARLA